MVILFYGECSSGTGKLLGIEIEGTLLNRRHIPYGDLILYRWNTNKQPIWEQTKLIVYMANAKDWHV